MLNLSYVLLLLLSLIDVVSFSLVWKHFNDEKPMEPKRLAAEAGYGTKGKVNGAY